uniref:Uncharacterized protein n=1 Tax=Tanacetum cinerariifolium TaxID=118510 RepID=A0A6L2N0D4_TANCI|nr:hypothetical protein [Tanacetum cinerariifolium]
MLLNMDQLDNQLDKEEFQEDRSMAAFWVINKQFQMFIDSQFTWDYDSQMTKKYFAEYIGIEVEQFRETLLQHMGNVKKSVAERTRHKRQYDIRVNKRQTHASKVDSSKALDADLVVMESNGAESGKQDTSSSSENYLTHVVDADIRLVNDQMSFDEVQLTAQHNVIANEQQHTEQSEPIYDTYLLEKIDSNTTPDLTNTCHRRGEIDQDAEQYQVKSPLLNAEFFKRKICSGPGPHLMTLETISSGLVQNIPCPSPAVPPTNNDWDSLFQPMFDEYFIPLPNVDHPVPKVPAPVPAASTSLPSSTTVD